jgi:CheY-like chemotaxis protein
MLKTTSQLEKYMSHPRHRVPTVLVVDDDVTVRTLERTLLEVAGYAVIEAADGECALQLASTERPDLVILDVALPTISGLDVLQALAVDSRTTTIPVLVVSSYAPLIAEEHRAWMSGALTKPFDPRVFLEAVHRAAL